MTFSPYDFLKVERHGPVGWLINDRPEQLNAMNNSRRTARLLCPFASGSFASLFLLQCQKSNDQ